ncbi:MAG TPA: macrolide ABC transporter ATP-binding protein, partial [Bacteroidetes bacterium]|nr:macrolide ABC transporter ATP-binding protein [Bacteroidota bacterium]
MAKEIIRLEKISRHYHVGTEIVKALQEIDISINKNEFVAMMGPSGSG